MSVFDRFERAIEEGMNGAFSKVFKSNLKPVDIASALRRAMEDRAATISEGRTVVPNSFSVRLSPSDVDAVKAANPEVLAQELADNITSHAIEQRYTFVGPVTVGFQTDNAQLTGTVRVEAATKRGSAAPVTFAHATPEHPVIDIEGKQWMLTEPVTVVGRGSDADIVINDPGVSRAHAEIRITPTGVILTDLGSTNGTFVEGHRIDAATLLNGNEITVGRTRFLFWTSDGEDDFA